MLLNWQSKFLSIYYESFVFHIALEMSSLGLRIIMGGIKPNIDGQLLKASQVQIKILLARDL